MAERKDDRLWGGRFENAPDARFDAFQQSFAFDRRLLPYEVAVDRAWAKSLQGVGIFTETEVRQTLAALDKTSARAQSDKDWLDSSTAEDVHQFVENALVDELGPLGWKLHTGRSRNELVATDFRLFVIDAAAEIRKALLALINGFLLQAKENLKVPMAGMTHMQHAQPILLSHFLMAHAEAFSRDLARLPSMLSVTATLRSIISLHSRVSPPISQGSRKILSCSLRRNSPTSSCPTNIPPAAA